MADTMSKQEYEELTGAAVIVVGVIIVFFVIVCGMGSKKKQYKRTFKQKAPNSVLSMFNVRHVNAIVDQFRSVEEVTSALRKAGLESSNIIFGVDFTSSNAWQGEKTFDGKSLHTISTSILNPYQRVIQIMGETLEPFDEDGIIPAFGFGDASTKDKSVFPFRAEGYCRGFLDVLDAYNQLTPAVTMSGPTNYAPLIYRAIDIVRETKAYHILVIIADGQVTSERATSQAIVKASKYPLSIIVVGVGDGPWDTMYSYDDRLPARDFDNFQFVDFNQVLTYGGGNPAPTFALHALMEIPDQFKTIREMGLLDM